MEVQVKGKGVEITDALRDYANRKVNKLTNHFGHLTGAVVTQTVQGVSHRVEVQLEGDGVKVRGEESGSDMYAALDHVVDKLERRLQKFKGRQKHTGGSKNSHLVDGDAHHEPPHHHHYGKHGEPVSVRTAPVVIDGMEEEPVTGRIVRHKKFDIKPLGHGEAVQQMELLGHDFFAFLNARTNEVNILYRREDGNYGILEPER